MNDLIVVDPLYISVRNLALDSVAESSKNTYAQTYGLWLAWCNQNAVEPSDLRPDNVKHFLLTQYVTKRTLQRYLSAIRTLAKVMALDYTKPEYRAIYEALRLIKVPEANLKKFERKRHALDPQEVWKVLNVWNGDDVRSVRNYALLCTLFYTGIRRAESVTLIWKDVNLTSGVITIRHGKGDKEREVAIVGDTAIRALSRWKSVQTSQFGGKCIFVFTSISKGEKITDKGLHPRAVNQIVEETEKLSGVEFTVHDTRRTLGTDLLAKGHSTADVQEQLGHSHASTTIQGYGIAANARKRRARFDTSY